MSDVGNGEIRFHLLNSLLSLPKHEGNPLTGGDEGCAGFVTLQA